MSLLGALLIDREAIGLTVQIIGRDRSDMFYRQDHRLIYETVVDLYDAAKPIDLVVVEDELRRRNILEEVGGRDYLIDLHESVPSAANAEYYANIVRDKAMLRDLILATGQIMSEAYDDSDVASEIMDRAEQKLFEVTEQRVSQHAVPIKDFLQEAWAYIEDPDLHSGIPTGFTEFDHMTGGLQFGDLVVIAARPSMGKTAFALSMFESIGIDENQRQGFASVFFSLEMGKLQIAQRLLCARARVDMSRMRRDTLSEEEMLKLRAAHEQIRDKPIFIDDTPGMSVMEIRAKSRRLKLQHNIQVIFIDYLQLMQDPSNRESRQQEIASISRGLKALGRELNVPIVALAQLNRQVEGRGGNRPRMSDLRESGAIEQDADVVALLHREEYYADKGSPDAMNELRGKAELILDKQRNGPTGIIDLHFTKECARFDNASAGYIDEPPPGYRDVAPPLPPSDMPPLPGGNGNGHSGPSFPIDDEEAPF